MRIWKFGKPGDQVYVLQDDEGEFIDWAELDNIERLEKRIAQS